MTKSQWKSFYYISEQTRRVRNQRFESSKNKDIANVKNMYYSYSVSNSLHLHVMKQFCFFHIGYCDLNFFVQIEQTYKIFDIKSLKITNSFYEIQRIHYISILVSQNDYNYRARKNAYFLSIFFLMNRTDNTTF